MKNFFALAFLLCGLTAFCHKESLSVNWPPEYKFKEITNEDNGQIRIVEMVPEKESAEKWTLLVQTMFVKDAKIPSTDLIVKLFEQSSKANAPDAKLTVLEADDAGANIWVLFKVETPKFNDDPKPESQLYYATVGAQGLHIDFVAIKKKELPKDFVTKWSAVFKAAKLVSVP